MIDLREDTWTLQLYAQRYKGLSPKNSRELQLRMEYDPLKPNLPTSGEEQNSKPEWLNTPPCLIPESESLDKAKGALVGLAIGDAIGTTLEFLPRDKLHVNDMVGGGPFRLQPGEWTDDTSMALCLAESYISAGRLDITLFREKLVRWYRYGENSSNGRCFDIGNTTRNALEQYLKHGASWFGNTEPETAGNAAIIRQAPTSIFRRKSLQRTFADSDSQSMATHCAPESMASCQFLGFILNYLINGSSREKAFSPHVMPLPVRVLLINAGEYKEKKRDEIRSSGYVIDTLEAAMWAVWNTDNFHDAILLAANLGDDADSVAATTGQIAGALYGYSNIPKPWLDKLVQQERISNLAEQLFYMAPEEDF
ncbi:ADP-ribosylarginine hydrolase Tri1 [Serratia quinivorans]|uniref:ADP-ribosylarginine hydrolase Tri1 n=1 Tax=Serratia quinivorans TaxID=137545 RepID=UPI001C4380DE|nr:ADP-ribosylarginine hydrolase Tri1 [Serratia quinivorans]MBV6692925.1 ADP-ribosylglycohydrolase family protein [Serratia quinivorans]